MTRRWGVAALAAALQPVVVAGPAAALVGVQRVASDGVCWALTALAVGLAAVEAGGQRVDDDVAGSAADRCLASTTAAALWAMLAGAVALRAGAPPGLGGSWLGGAVGVALFVAGVALRAAAMRELGAHFVTEARSGQRLVTEGAFGWVRHPSEAGLVAIGAGIVALVPHAALVAVFLGLLAPSIWLRVRREDRALALSAPLAHARYAAGVGAVAPRIGALVDALRGVSRARVARGLRRQSGESAFAIRFSTPTRRNGEQ